MQNPATHDLLTSSYVPCAAKVRSALRPLGNGPVQVPRGTLRAPEGIARG